MSPEQVAVFLAYTERFDKIFSSFPISLRKNEEYSQADITADHEQAAIRFFNLCAEEFYLADEKLIQSDVWTAWKSQLAQVVKQHLVFSQVWKTIRNEYTTQKLYANFLAFMDSEVPK